MNDEDCYHIDELDDGNINDQKHENHIFTSFAATSTTTPIIPDIVPGILYTHQTFGLSKSGKKYLYKVIPHDVSLSPCLVSYDLKVEFNKKSVNKFVLFKYTDDYVNNNIIVGILAETLGNEDDLNAYFEYLLYAKNVHVDTRDFNKQFKVLQTYTTSLNNHFDKYNFCSEKIITIDNENTEFYDDALSIRFINEKTITVSVFIANVPGWLEHMDLWRHMYNMKTIYLQHKRHLMLPRGFTKMCSLQENEMRNAVHIQYTFVEKSEGGVNIIGTPEISISVHNICVAKNHHYESDALKNDPMYQTLLRFSQQLDPSIVNSRELVRFWMIHCNRDLAEVMKSRNIGLYKPFYDRIDSESLVKSINSKARLNNHDHHREYYTTNKNENYAQFTCPLRRMADIINLTQILKNDQFPLGNGFIRYWMSNLKEHNEAMINIRKIENKCYLMNLLKNANEEEVIYDALYIGNNIIQVPSLNRLFHIPNHVATPAHEITKCKIYVIKHSIFIQCY